MKLLTEWGYILVVGKVFLAISKFSSVYFAGGPTRAEIVYEISKSLVFCL